MSPKVYLLKRSQILPISKSEAWEFFSTPYNLEKLTPKDIGFKILTCSSDKMVAGQIITYKINVFPLIWIRWITEITHVEENQYFVDDQRKGPYALWHHRHAFTEVDNGTLMEDEIHYALPFGILGTLAHTLFIHKKLERIFDYRYEVLKKIFPR